MENSRLFRILTCVKLSFSVWILCWCFMSFCTTHTRYYQPAFLSSQQAKAAHIQTFCFPEQRSSRRWGRPLTQTVTLFSASIHDAKALHFYSGRSFPTAKLFPSLWNRKWCSASGKRKGDSGKKVSCCSLV